MGELLIMKNTGIENLYELLHKVGTIRIQLDLVTTDKGDHSDHTHMVDHSISVGQIVVQACELDDVLQTIIMADRAILLVLL